MRHIVGFVSMLSIVSVVGCSAGEDAEPETNSGSQEVNERKPVPKRLEIRCQSPALGYVEMSLTNDQASTDFARYDMVVKRFDAPNGRELGTSSYTIGDDKAQVSMNWYGGDREPTSGLRGDPSGVDWTNPSNAKKCYVKAPSPGFSIGLGLKTGKFDPQWSPNGPTLTPYQRNPAVETRMTPGIGWPTLSEVLNGRKCEDIDNFAKASDMTCQVKSME